MPADAHDTGRESGHVYFLGAGPGDPGLMTNRGSELLARADVVVADAEVHAEIIDAYVPVTTRRLDAAELGATASTRGRKLSELAHTPAVVVRLVDDDGVLFSTTTAEAAACSRAGVDFEIVPGVGIYASISAYTGTPITTNRVRSVRFIEAGAQTHTDVSKHRNTGHVVTGRIDEMRAAIASLLADKWDPETPALVSAHASTLQQVTIEGRLGDLAEKVERVGGPADRAVLLLGEGIEKRAELSWFESKPLFGWKVLVPRTKEQASSTVDLLSEYGAEGTVVPTIEIQPPRTPTQMEKAIRALVDGDYHWIGFTSVNAVKAIREWLGELGLDARVLSGVKVAAVGGRTAASLRDWGVEPDLIPTEEHSARGLAAVWPDFDPSVDPIDNVLLPRADIATEVLVEGLTARGWQVDDVTAYRTVRAAPPPAPIRESIKSGDFDAVLFTSSSTVRNLVGIAGKPHKSTVVACIGPATAQTAREHGLRVDVLAEDANLRSLVTGLAAHARVVRDEYLAAGQTPRRPSQTRRKSRKRT